MLLILAINPADAFIRGPVLTSIQLGIAHNNFSVEMWLATSPDTLLSPPEFLYK